MRLLELLANAFINTFGITHPTAQTRRRAAWFILALLILVVFAMTATGAVIYRVAFR